MKYKGLIILLIFSLGTIQVRNLLFGQSKTLLPVVVNGKWGIINPQGNILIKPQYDFMPKFDEFGLATIIRNGKLGIIDSMGTTVISSQYDDIRIIDQQLYLVSNNGSWGIIKKDEAIILDIEYSQIESLSNKYFQVKKGDKTGLINYKGKKVVPVDFKDIELALEGYYLIKNDNKWGIYQEDQGLIQPCIYDKIKKNSHGNFFIKKENKWGLFLTKEKKVSIEPAFDLVDVLQGSDLYITPYLDNLKGIYQNNGSVILEPTANNIIHFQKNRFLVLDDNNRWGILNKDGNWLETPKWRGYEKMNNNFIAFYNRFGEKTLFSSKTDSIVLPAQFKYFERFSENLIIARGAKTSALLTTEGQLITMGKFKKYKSIGEGIFAAYSGEESLKSKESWALFNSLGKRIHPSNFDNVSSFMPELKIARVLLGGKIGLLKPDGSWLIEPNYSRISVFDEVIKAYDSGKVTIFNLNEDGSIADNMTFNNVKVVKINNLNIKEKIFKNGLSSDSATTRFRTFINNTRTNDNYVSLQFGSFKNRWALWNTQKNVFKSLENHKIMRFLYTFGRYEIRFGWVYPGKVNHRSRAGRVTQVKIYKRKETLNYIKQVYNRPKKIHIGYVGNFVEGRARVNIGGTFKSVGLSPTTKRYDLGDEVKGLIIGEHERRLSSFGGRGSSSVNRAYTFVCSGGHWSFIDEEGELIGEFEYSYVNNFHNGVAIAEKRGKWGVIDKKNNEVIPFKYSFIDYLPESDSTLFRLYANDKLYGYVDSLGNQIVPTQFEKIEDYSEGVAQAKQLGKWGFIDTNGEWAIQNKFDDVKRFNEGLAPAKKGRFWGFINKNGNWVIEPKFRDVGCFSEGIAAAKDKVLFGYINRSGGWIIEPKFQRAEEFNGGVAIAKVKGKFGLLSKTGNWKLSPHFKKFSKLDNNYFIASKNAWGLISKEGKPLTKFKYFSIDQFSNGYARVRKKASNYFKRRYGLIDSLGNEVINTKYYKSGEFNDGLIRVKNLKEDWKYINIKEETIFTSDTYESCTDFSEGKAVVFTKKGRLQGGKFINMKGEILFNDTNYEAVSTFVNGRAVVRMSSGQYAFIDSLGQIVNDAYYKEVKPFQYKISFVKKQSKWAITNHTSTPISQFMFDEVDTFKKGLAKVAVNVHYGIADTNGETIAPPHFETVKSISNKILMVASANRIGYINTKSGDWLWPLQN